MAGLCVRTVALSAARRHWRRSSQQLLWTLKVSRAGLMWAWLPGVPRRYPQLIPAPGAPGPGPEQAALTRCPATGHLLNTHTRVKRLKRTELYLRSSGVAFGLGSQSLAVLASPAAS